MCPLHNAAVPLGNTHLVLLPCDVLQGLQYHEQLLLPLFHLPWCLKELWNLSVLFFPSPPLAFFYLS